MEEYCKNESLEHGNPPCLEDKPQRKHRQCDIYRMEDVASLLRIPYVYIVTEIKDDCFTIYYEESTKIFLCCLKGGFFTYAYMPCVGGKVTYKEDFLRWRGQATALVMPFLDRYIFQLEPKPLPYREVIYIKNNETEKPAKPALNSGKSMLRYLGYDVSTKKSLCAFERKTILKRIIAIEYLMNKSDVIAHIESNINRYQHNPKMRRAVIRWQEDLEYIQKIL